MVHVVIAGAGIVVVSSAIWLQRAGHEVTLVDRMDGVLRTSYGNAGVLAAGAILPVPVPRLARKLPKMVFSRNEPLFLQWRCLPRLLPFLIKYSALRAQIMWHIVPVPCLTFCPIAMPNINLWPREPYQ